MIPKGYKHTELGILPQHWEVVRLGEVTECLDHQRIPLNEIQRAKCEKIFPYYGASGMIDYVDDYIFDEKLVLLGEDGANIIDRSTRLAFCVEGKIWVNNHAHVLRPKGTNQYFLAEVLESLKYDKYNTGTAQPKLNQKAISRIQIPLPPLAEQEKIAEILSTWDTQIQNLCSLIKEKQTLKKGLCQTLLTAKTRFKGFDEDWEVVSVGKIFKITRGNILAMDKLSILQDDHNPYPVFSSKTKDGGLLGFYSEYLFENCITWTTDGANAGEVNFRKGKFYCTNVCGVLISDVGYCNQCIAEILNAKTGQYVSYVGNPKLMNNVVREIKIKIPLNVVEQEKIAEVLSEADNEINLLEQKLESLKSQKKGLMQKLLNGKVRVR